MDKEIRELLALLIQNQSQASGCPSDCSFETGMRQTLVRHNEQAAQVSANFMQNAQNQQSSNAAMLMKLTADITKPS